MLTLHGEILSESFECDAATLVRYCRLQHEELFAMVDSGLLEPRGAEPSAWRFSGVDLQRARLAHRLTQDLGVNMEGAALIVELLEERTALQSRMRVLSALLEERVEES
jgi:chaperone modulatory protein CbpM